MITFTSKSPFHLPSVPLLCQWAASRPPACPRSSPAPSCPKSASTWTRSSPWTTWRSTRSRWTACTCSTIQTWSSPTPPPRKRFASTGSSRRLPGRPWVGWGREGGRKGGVVWGFSRFGGWRGGSGDSTPKIVQSKVWKNERQPLFFAETDGRMVSGLEASVRRKFSVQPQFGFWVLDA